MVTCLLRDFVLSCNTTPDALQVKLDACRSSPIGGCLWVDCLIYPVILAYLFIWGEKEGNWVLHLCCCKCMLAYFMEAGHWHYARYLFWYVLEFYGLAPQDALTTFHLGNNVCRHKPGSSNSVFSDQFGQQTYIHYG